MTAEVVEHYAEEGLLTRLREALGAEGALSPLSLAPLDQFHVRGLAATVELAEMARIVPGDNVLDVGSGLGGPARVLTALAGARVVGLDLTPVYCEAARWLSARCGLAVDYRVGDGLDMPFDSGRFDVVWSQHVAMNVADRPALYREMRRVLRSGGRACFYDVVRVGHEQPHFPVPWATDAATSHLVTRDDMGALLAAAGFEPIEWRDATSLTPASGQPTPPFALARILGPSFAERFKNLVRSLGEGRVGLVMGIFRAT